jgi:MoxR-like ATPase
MLKLKVEYPNMDQELIILRRMAKNILELHVDPVLSPSNIVNFRNRVDEIYMDEKIEEYIVRLVDATRHPETYKLNIGELIQYGASPRATIHLALGAKAHALLRGRGFVTPDDVKNVAMDVLRHRVIVSYEAEAEEKTPEDLIRMILDTVEVP